jgi:phage-related protein
LPPNFSAGSASINVVPDFTGAQRAVGQWLAGLRDVKIKVTPDLDQTASRRVKEQVDGIHPNIKIDVDFRDLERQSRRVVDTLTGFSTVGNAIGQVFSPRSTMIVGAVGSLVAVAGAASQAAGAVGLLPAAGAAAAAPIATLAIGLQGVGDAFKAISAGDPQKIADAMKNLAPAARDFVTQTQALAPAWTNLRLDVQNTLFQNLGDRLTALAQAQLPVFQKGLHDVADAMNSAAQGTASFLSQSSAIADVRAIFDNITVSLRSVFGAVVPVVQAITDIGTVGSQFLPSIGGWIFQGAVALQQWIATGRESGAMASVIGNGIATIQQLLSIVLNVGQSAWAILRTTTAAGQSMLSTLDMVTGRLLDFLNTPVAQSALTGFFNSLASVIATIGPVLNTVAQVLVTALLPALGGLAQSLAPIVAGVVTQFAFLLQQIAPMLYPTLVNAIVVVLSALTPLMNVFSAVAMAILPPLTHALQMIAPLFSQIAEVVGGALIQAVQAIAPLLPFLVDAILQIIQAIMPLIPTLLQIVVSLLPPIIQIIQILVPIIVGLVQVIAPLLNVLLQLIGPILPPLVYLIGALALAVLALSSPFTIIEIAIAAFVAGLVYAWNNSQTFRDIVLGVWDAIKNAAILVFQTTLLPIWQGLVAGWNAMVAAIQWAWVNILKPVWDFIAIAAQLLFAAVLTVLITPFILYWQLLTTMAQFYWDNVLHPVWIAIEVAAHWLWENVLLPIWAAMQAGWAALLITIQFYWNTVLHPAWIAIEVAAHWLWENVLLPIWAAMQAGWNTLVTLIQWGWNNVLRPTWDVLAAAANFLWNNVLSPVWNAMQTAWNALMTTMRFIYDTQIHPMWTIIQQAVGVVKAAFDSAVSGISAAWDRLRGVVAVPVNFVVRTVLRDGLFAAWNWVLDQMGIAGFHVDLRASWLQGIQGFASGGWTGPGEKNKAAGIVHADEFVFTKEQTNAIGKDRLEELADAFSRNGGYNKGGPVGDMFLIDPDIAVRTKAFLDAFNAGQPEAIQAAGGWFSRGPRGYLAGGAVDAALNQVRLMQGTPYIWGGVGRGGVDCSGLQSQVTNILRGRSPYSRVGTTATFPWAGFASGLGTYSIGNSKSYGHMAGTLAGNNVESGSGHGAMIGGRALGATSSMFNEHGFLPEVGGVFTDAGPGGGAPAEPPWYVKLWGTVTGALDWLRGKISAVNDMVGRFSNSPLIGWLKEVPGKMLGHAWDSISGKITNLFNSIVTVGQDVAAGDTAGTRAAIQGVANLWGWQTGPQWAGIDYIITHESGWNPRAQNPVSTASGLFQQIDGTWISNRPIGETAAHMKDARVASQGQAGLRYIKSRFGDPVGAQRFWETHHYYDSGGWLPPGITTVYNGTGRPEPVLTAAEHDALVGWRTWQARNANAAGTVVAPTVHVYIGNEELNGYVDVRLDARDDENALSFRSATP